MTGGFDKCRRRRGIVSSGEGSCSAGVNGTG